MIQFGTGGWRAVIGDGFTRKNIQLLARAVAMKMKREGVEKEGIVIGYDRRFLSKEAVKWACEVFAAEQIHCWFVNRSSPTPLIMYYVEKHGMHYGMMVTASHNPAIYNGIKIFTYGGRDASEEQTREIEGLIREAEAAGRRPVIAYETAKAGGLVTEFNPINEYLDSIIARINMQAIRDRGLHVVLDPMYGVSQISLKTILSTARCETDVIHGAHDTLFGRRMPAPSRESLTELCTYVKEMECDLGLATDGDADRIGVVDDRGRYLHANDILALLYYYLLQYRGWRGPAVRNVATTHLLDRMAEDFGEKCYEVPVGFKYISAKMQEIGAIIGGESSGGLTIRGHINGKDGIYAAMLLVEMIAVTGRKLSELADEIEKKYGAGYMEERSYRFAEERREELQELLLVDKQLPDFGIPIEKVSYLDGCKVYFQDGGWIIARFSGTEPLLRIFCEMEEESRVWRQCFCRFDKIRPMRYIVDVTYNIWTEWEGVVFIQKTGKKALILVVFLLTLCFAGTIHASAKTVNAVTSAKTVKNGKWVTSGSQKRYKYSSGSYAKNTWLKIGDSIYRFDSKGYCETGWFTVDGTKFYAAKNGKLYVKRWLKSGKNKYYLQSSGACAVKKWLKIGGKYYYFGKTGKLATKCFITTGNKCYYVNGSGVRMKNIRLKVNGKFYYLDKNGVRLQKKWVKLGGKYYYFGSNGVMVTKKWVGNYYVDSTGARKTNCIVDGYYLDSTGKKTVKVFKGDYIFVGDSRTVGMSSAKPLSNTKYIAKVGVGYSWLKSTGGVTLQNYLKSNPDVTVVLALGVNDLGNVSSYISYYRSLIKKYPKTRFYITSVNPVDEKLEAANGYSVKNSSIVSFNKKIKSAFGSSVYIDTYSYLKKKGFATWDGLHYSTDVYAGLYEFIVEKIK